MASNEFIAAVELSSSHIAGIAGLHNADGSLQVLAYASEEAASCIHKGIVFNIDETAAVLTTIINRLESQLDASIAQVYVGIGGLSMRTVRNAVSRDVNGDGIISQELVDNLCDENLAIPIEDMDILDVAPQEYIIDNSAQVKAVGVAGNRVTAQFLNIVARTSLKKNLEYSFDKAKVEIADLVIAPAALARVVLTDTEMRSGCALVDFGAETTTVSVYKNNILRFLSVIPLGNANLTRDLTTLQMEESEAESLKQRYGDLSYEEENSDIPATCQTEDGRAIPLTTLNFIIAARSAEILNNVWNQIQLSQYDDRLLGGVVFTGGGANLRHLEEVFRKQTKMTKVRTARFVQPAVHGKESELKKDGTLNTLLGLLAVGHENCRAKDQESSSAQTQDEHSLLNPETGDMFRDDEALKEQEAAAAEAARAKKEAERQAAIDRQKAKKEKGSWFGRMKKAFEDASNDLFQDNGFDDKENNKTDFK
ncbi:MAG: cell division protein FtsA [Mediterranea sp.]|jgi:cell division protein FtsA|nr:cell division protein FtsA [Mediterranea sp.]